MGIKQTDQSKKGKLEYRGVATVAIGEMAAHMLISSFWQVVQQLHIYRQPTELEAKEYRISHKCINNF